MKLIKSISQQNFKKLGLLCFYSVVYILRKRGQNYLFLSYVLKKQKEKRNKEV